MPVKYWVCSPSGATTSSCESVGSWAEATAACTQSHNHTITHHTSTPREHTQQKPPPAQHHNAKHTQWKEE